MADSSMESIGYMDDDHTFPNSTSDESSQRPAKLKGRKRLLQSLHRISSSSSISRLGRPPSASYRGAGKGSMSCISLSGASHTSAPSTPYSSQVSNGYSTAPTSVPSTPGPEANTSDPQSKVRFVGSSGLTRPRTSGSMPVPAEGKLASRPTTSLGVSVVDEDYFSRAILEINASKPHHDFDFWGNMPCEIKVQILRLLEPRQIVRSSAVSRSWHKMCFDGQLWGNMDTTDFYQDIPAEGLIKIVTNAGPFVRDLNLRGCVQLWESWRGTGLADACRNLENLSLEGCRIDRSSIHSFLYQNARLIHVNLSGLGTVDNTTMRIVAQFCPRMELLNVSWCSRVTTKGLRKVVESCPSLRDLRASEVSGFDNIDFMHELFESNALERLVLANCDSLTDESLQALFEGDGDEIDFLTGRRVVPPRNLRHLDISRCRAITDAGLMALIDNVPHLEGLQLAKCKNLTDSSLTSLLPTIFNLTHLDLEELENLTNATLQELSKSSCAATLQHLNISYCENLGDTGMLPIVKQCLNLRNLDLDNTRISDLVLAEAAAMVRQRCSPVPSMTRPRAITWDGASAPQFSSIVSGPAKPKIGLRMVVYDCQNVTWTGIREVLSRNAEIRRPVPPAFYLPSFAAATTATSHTQAVHPAARGEDDHPTSRTTTLQTVQTQTQTAPSHPHQVISLKVFYGYQPTVTEHTRRVLRGDLSSASRLERKWADYMMASEEAGAALGVGTGNGLGRLGAANGLGNATVGLGLMGNRRRRRRVREAQMMHADEEEGGMVPGAIGRRRRARSGGGCAMM